MDIIGTSAAAISTLKSAYDLVSELRNSSDPAKLKAGLSELADRLLFAREQALKLSEEKEILRNEVQAFKAKAAERIAFEEQAKNYARTQTPGRAFVYMEKAPTEPDAPAPYFCPKCFKDEALFELQPTTSGKQECPNCKNTFQVDPAPKGSVGLC